MINGSFESGIPISHVNSYCQYLAFAFIGSLSVSHAIHSLSDIATDLFNYGFIVGACEFFESNPLRGAFPFRQRAFGCRWLQRAIWQLTFLLSISHWVDGIAAQHSRMVIIIGCLSMHFCGAILWTSCSHVHTPLLPPTLPSPATSRYAKLTARDLFYYY